MNHPSLKYYICTLVAVACVFLLALGSAIHLATPMETPSKVPTSHLNAGWFYETGGNWHPSDAFPCVIKSDEETLRFTRTLSDTRFYDDEFFLFRTWHTSIRVWAGDKLVYESATGRDDALGKLWHFVPLSAFGSSNRITVELTRYNNEEYWVLPEVLLDRADALRSTLLLNASPQLIFSALTFLGCALLMATGISLARRKLPGSISLLSLAMFIFLAGLWILLETRVTTLWGGNYSLTYLLGYAAYLLLLAPYILFLNTMLPHRHKGLTLLLWLVLGNAVSCFLLRLLFNIPLRYSSLSISILLLLAIPISLHALWHNTVQSGDETHSRWTFLGSIVIGFAAFLSSCSHFLSELQLTPPRYSDDGIVLFALALLILMVCMATDMIKTLNRILADREESERYHSLATQDSMTRVYNRNAFELGRKELIQSDPNRIAIAIFDLDGLKTINDQFGHHVGDKAIYMLAKCIQDSFAGKGYYFRLGGDEFCTLMVGDLEVEALPEALEKTLSSLQSQKIDDFADLHFSVSYGWSEWKRDGAPLQEEDISAVMKEADINMYHFKQSQRSARRSAKRA